MSANLRVLLSPSMEESSTGEANKEIEKVFYGKLTDLTELNSLKGTTLEEHEQWEIKVERTENNGGSGKIRIRKTTYPNEGGRVEYVLTTKVKMIKMKPEDHGNIEVSIPTTEDNFKQFKVLADSGMIKDRVSVPIAGTDLKWEIDLFRNIDRGGGEAHYCPWVKIDLELPSPDHPIPEFPIKFDELIGNEDSRTEKQEEIVKWLYENEFLAKNEYRR